MGCLEKHMANRRNFRRYRTDVDGLNGSPTKTDDAGLPPLDVPVSYPAEAESPDGTGVRAEKVARAKAPKETTALVGMPLRGDRSFR